MKLVVFQIFKSEKKISLLRNIMFWGFLFKSISWTHFFFCLFPFQKGTKWILTSIFKVGQLLHITTSVYYNNSTLLSVFHILCFLFLFFFSEVISIYYLFCCTHSLVLSADGAEEVPRSVKCLLSISDANKFCSLCWFSHTVVFLVFWVILVIQLFS